jgi:hypothetical protein
MMSLRTGTHQSVPTPQELPNNIMHPTRIMGLGFSRWWLRPGDGKRWADQQLGHALWLCLLLRRLNVTDDIEMEQISVPSVLADTVIGMTKIRKRQI